MHENETNICGMAHCVRHLCMSHLYLMQPSILLIIALRDKENSVQTVNILLPDVP